MGKLTLLCLGVCLLVLFHCCAADWQGSQQQRQRQRQRGSQQQQEGECQIQRLNAQEPQRRIQAEAGYTEFWDYTHDQFQCAGVAACRNVINPQGLLLPSYTNAPSLFYILRGRGIQGVMMPGCPETFQASQQSQEGQSRRFRDQHQKIRHFQAGDIIALPAGVAHWCYNDGNEDLVVLIMEDTNNNHNQLDNNPRKFFLAGNPQQSQQQQLYGPRRGEQQNFGNILRGIDVDTLAEIFRVDRETARNLQGQDDQRGHIVRAEHDLQVIRPQRTREEQEREERGQYGGRDNGLEETICTARLVQNINDPLRADIFNPRAGRLTSLNSFTLPILRFLQLSAEKGVLYRNAIMAPHWNLNAHCVLYATRGEAQMQIVDHRGQSVFNDRIQEGQLVVVPQNFVVVKQAGDDGFEWVAMKTNENAMFSTLAGRTSALRAMPVDVIANAYQISQDEARRLKERRAEAVMFEPSSRSRSERRADA